MADGQQTTGVPAVPKFDVGTPFHGVVILKDLMQINNRYDPIKDNMTLKKTVVQI